MRSPLRIPVTPGTPMLPATLCNSARRMVVRPLRFGGSADTLMGRSMVSVTKVLPSSKSPKARAVQRAAQGWTAHRCDAAGASGQAGKAVGTSAWEAALRARRLCDGENGSGKRHQPHRQTASACRYEECPERASSSMEHTPHEAPSTYHSPRPANESEASCDQGLPRWRGEATRGPRPPTAVGDLQR